MGTAKKRRAEHTYTNQYLAVFAKMEKHLCILVVLATFIKENVGSMSQEINKIEVDEQEKLQNSWLYNTEYQTVPHTSISSSDRNSESVLSCYECNSIQDGELCYNIGKNTTANGQHRHKIKQCPGDKPYCKVYRVEYLVLEDFKSTDTGPYTPWSMERNCSEECKNFCVTMGGRTKLTYCTSCCDTPC